MSSAVQALLEGHSSAARHGKRSAYRAMCACCAPEPTAHDGKPQRQGAKRPVLAWRTRLAQQQTQAAGLETSAV